jgi:hypothetical protein
VPAPRSPAVNLTCVLWIGGTSALTVSGVADPPATPEIVAGISRTDSKCMFVIVVAGRRPER